jgi:DNA-binding transcriptional LysR family regulator
LEKNEVDFALVSLLPDNLPVEKEELMENKLYLVGNNAQKFAKKENKISILEDLALIYREQGSATRKEMEKFITENKLSVQKKMELTSNEAVKQAIIAGLGYSIMPLIGIKNELNNGDLQIIRLKDLPIRSMWNLIWVKNKRFSPVAKAFLAYIREVKATIIKEKFDWFENY